MLPMEGLSPTSPVWLAGRRMEPPPSVPSASGAQPAATAAAAPPLDPPGVSAGFQGLPVVPNRGLEVKPSSVNSGTLVLPSTMAPAARTRATTSSSAAGRQPRSAGLPQVVGMSAVGRLSLSTTGTPSNGPQGEPLCQRAVLASASARAASSRWATKALSSGCTASLRARQASTTARGVSWPLR